jgi:tetratricopeptide (TPR) repeat protein
VPDYWNDLVAIQFNRINFLAASGRLETSMACRQALADAQKVLGHSLKMENKHTRLECLYGLLGCLLMDVGLLDDAAAALDHSLKLRQKRCEDYPEYLGDWTGLALTHRKRGRLLTLAGRTREAEEAYLQAVACLQKVVEAAPRCDFRRYELALMLGELGWLYLLGPAQKEDARKALPMIEKALELAPDGGMCLRTLLGVAYYRRGKWDQAIRTLEEVRASLEANNRSQRWKKADDSFLVQSAGRREGAAPGLTLWFLAMSYQRKGEFRKAACYYQQAQHWAPHYRVAPYEAETIKSVESEALRLRTADPQR